MDDARTLREIQAMCRRLLWDAAEEQVRDLAMLGLMVHVQRNVSMSPQAHQRVIGLLELVAPDLVLTLRALDQAALAVRRQFEQGR